MPLEGNIQHYLNGIEYNKMITQMLAKKMLKLGAIKIFPKGLASVQDGFEYMMTGKVMSMLLLRFHLYYRTNDHQLDMLT